MGLFSFFFRAKYRSRRPAALSSRPGTSPHGRFRRLLCEGLEDRRLLSLLPTITSLSASTSSSVYGQPVSFVATVTTNPPSGTTPTGGTVYFVDNGIVLATAPLTAGSAVWTTTSLAAGQNQLGVSYSGDGVNFSGSSSSSTLWPFSVIATAAGNGTGGYGGDNGPATAAELNAPAGVASDGKGHLFIADASNNVVREVNLSSGSIVTVAGNGTAGFSGDNGPATAAELHRRRAWP